MSAGNSTRHVLRRAARSLVENAYLNLVATGVIGASLLLVGVYLTVQFNLNTIVDTWERDVHISAYFHRDVSEQRRFAVRDEVAAMPEVVRVNYVSEADARAYLSERVEGMDAVLDELGTGVLPASLEITLDPGMTHPAAIADFATRLSGPDFHDIDYGQEWVERFNTFLNLVQLLGALLGVLILVAALFLVTNTVHLVVYNRRDELEIQKLVGGTNTMITAPFLLEGLAQGLAGSGLAIVGLWGVHTLLVVRLKDALSLSLAGEVAFLPAEYLMILALAGAVLGVGAAGLATQRFLAKAP